MKLVTVRPGPVLHVFDNGREVACVPLDPNAARALAADILREMPRDLIERPQQPEPERIDLHNV